MTRARRRVVVLVVPVVVLLAAGAWAWAAGGPGVQRLEGPVGVPAVWSTPRRPPTVVDRPLEAASMAVRSDGDVLLAAADGRGYRRLPVPSGDDGFRLSPDGRSIAWRSGRNDEKPGAMLWIAHLADPAYGRWVAVAPAGAWPVATSFDWSPDSRRLVVAGADRVEAAGLRRNQARLWDVDARTGAALLLCACGQGVRTTAEGRFVQVPVAASGPVEPVDPLPPPYVLRLPPGPGGALVDPGGTRWLAPAPDGSLTITAADGGVRTLRPAAGSTARSLTAGDLLAWTDDGVWLVVRGATYTQVGLMDPDTGRVRTLTHVRPAGDPLTVATGVAAGGAVVTFDQRAESWYAPAGIVDRLRTVAGVASLGLTVALLGLSPAALVLAVVLVAGAVVLGRAMAPRGARTATPPPAPSDPPDPS